MAEEDLIDAPLGVLGHPSNATFLAGRALGAPMVEASAFPRRVAFGFYTLVLLTGIAFYVIWGAIYSSWNMFTKDNAGVYAVTVITVGFGVIGMLLYRRPLPPPQ